MAADAYVSLSAQIALQKRMDTVAHNVANTSTPGFRAEGVRFETLLAQGTPDAIAFVNSGESYVEQGSGALIQTGNPLDVAVKGNAYLAIATPAGQVLTRDGRMQMSNEGELRTLNGHAVLDTGGAPIQIDPNGGSVAISPDGSITQGGRQLGAIGLFTFPPNAKLSRYENSGVVPDVPAEPVVDFAKVSVAQGFIEQSNVNPIAEISRLIMVTRAYEAISNSITQSDSQQRDAIRALGPTS